MRRGAEIAVATALAATAAMMVPGLASASTVASASGTVTFTAAAGETNAVTVSRDGANYVVTDPGSAITPSAPCAAAGANAATCPVSGVRDLRVLLGNMNDSGMIASSVTGPSIGGDIRGQAGGDTLINEADIDFTFLLGDEAGDPAATDTIVGGPSRESLNGGAGNDSLTAGGDADNLGSEPGDDSLDAGPGDDRMFAGFDPDGADALIGGPGNDSVEYDSRGRDLRLTADDVADDGEPGEGDNVSSDTERLQSGDGDDVLVGGPGFNDFFAGDGDDTIDGGGGPDQVFAGGGNDTVAGGPGADELSPFTGADVVDGGDGDDELVSGTFDDEADSLAGGAGSDLVDYSAANAGVVVTLDGVPDDGIPGESDNAMPDLEDVVGGEHADTLTGNTSDNQLSGGEGDDVIAGLDGSDAVLGERGSDSLDGGEGNDSLAGEAGADRLRSRDAGADENSCGAGLDTVLADLDDEAGADCEETSTGVAFTDTKAKLSDEDKAKLELSCPAAEAVDCNGKLTLTAKRKGKKQKLDTAKLSIPSGADENVAVKLSNKAADAFANAKKIRADAVATMTDAAGATATSEARVVLVRKGKR